MGVIIFLAVIGLVFIIAMLAGFVMQNSEDKAVGFGIAAAAFVFFWIVWIFSSVFNVEARTVGIITEFGKAVDTAGPGINWASPWSQVTHFSTGNQTLDFDGTDGNGGPVGFKLAGEKTKDNVEVGGGEAAVHVNVTWQVENDDKAIKLWENWKEFDRVKETLVDKNSKSVIAGVMGRYNSGEANKGENLAKFSEEIKIELNKRFANEGIRIETVAVMKVDFSQAVQDRINKQYQDQEDVNRSVIQGERAKQEAANNKIRLENLTPEVLTLKCLELTNAWNDDNNGQLPPGWNCFGSNYVTSGR